MKARILLLLLFHIQTIGQINPCNLTGGSVYINHASAPLMMNATVNGSSNYSYAWTDTSGSIVSTANQTQFYTQWCVKITDIITGCDTQFVKIVYLILTQYACVL